MRSSWWTVVCRWTAAAGGAGWVPVAPGTAGSAVGLLLVVWVGPDPLKSGWLILATTLVALLTISTAERSFGTPDARQIVIDEVVGMAITLWSVPHRWPMLGVGFLLFRVMDVLKPPPLRWLERLRTPWGVLLDDVGAGVYARLLLQAWLRWAP